MDFNQIRYFLALTETLNFTRAAERCYVSQPALTQSIKRLEDELGGALFLREGRNTELTSFGQALKGYFEQINQTRELVSMTAKALVSGDIAELNIGVMCTIGPRLLAGMLNEFQINHPMVSISLHDVTPSVIPNMLLTGGLDAVFCASHDADDPRLHYVELFEEPMVVAFPPGHEFSSYEHVTLLDIVKQRYVERLHCEFRKETYEFSSAHKLKLDVAFRSEREDWIQSMVRDGVGVSIIPRYSLLQPELDYRLIVNPPLSRKVGLIIINDVDVSPVLSKLIQEAMAYNWPSLESGDS